MKQDHWLVSPFQRKLLCTLLTNLTWSPSESLKKHTISSHDDVGQSESESVSRGDFQYFFIFTDEFSRYGYIYLISHKSEWSELFKKLRVKYKIN
jgi:hypothetical protein